MLSCATPRLLDPYRFASFRVSSRLVTSRFLVSLPYATILFPPPLVLVFKPCLSTKYVQRSVAICYPLTLRDYPGSPGHSKSILASRRFVISYSPSSLLSLYSLSAHLAFLYSFFCFFPILFGGRSSPLSNSQDSTFLQRPQFSVKHEVMT
ncbi:hypothetical protein EDB86DRAFT_1010354 [Lactarius hatsudake]|nr:hypothetical protein EDB86DRAFT_1010354 [Lactarius hatsudake]